MESLDDFPLIPQEEGEVAPDEAVDEAVAGLEDLVMAPGTEEEVPEPFGKTPLFDFERGRFAMKGGDVVYVSGLESVKQWCLMAVHSARYAHAVFTDDFGMEDPDSVLGEAADLDEHISDWGDRLRDALLVHDRISAVEDFAAHFDPPTQTMVIDSFTVITDEEDRLDFGGLSVALEV